MKSWSLIGGLRISTKRALKYQATQIGLIISWFSWKAAEFVAERAMAVFINILLDEELH